MTTGILATIILAVILGQIVIVMLIGFYRRKRQYQNLDKEMDGAENISNIPTRSSTKPLTSDRTRESFKEFVVQRREIEDANNSVCSFYLVPVDEEPLPVYKPGQFLTFRLPIKDPDTDEIKSVVRCYSLSDAARPDYYRVTIKQIPAPPDQTDIAPGIASGFFHNQVQKGSHLLVKAPSGHFHLIEENLLPIVLIGGGIGITPMLSILNTVLESGINREIWLYYGVCNSNDHIMKKHLQKKEKKHDNFHLHVCYSTPNENDIGEVDYQHNSRVTISLLRATLKLMRYQFYVCGPKSMMETLVPGLKDWGVDSGDIYYESFGHASLIKHEKKNKKSTSEQPITVTFSQSGKSIIWDSAADSLLEFAESNDIEVESGCRAGSCGSCQTVVKTGEVDYDQEPDVGVEPGQCLLCISTPKCDLTLDA